MPRPHVSYSELCSFAQGCQWKWKLSYLDGHRTENFSIHFDFGTAVHEAMEKHLTRLLPLSVDAAVALFHETFDRLLAESRSKYDKPVSDKDVAGLHESGERIVRAVGKVPELQGLEVVHNEYKLFEPISREDGVDIKFKGFIDIVFKGKDKRGKPILWVCDFKTCSWGWGRDKREDRWTSYQLFLYKHFLCKRFNIDPKHVRTAFVLLKKRPPKGADVIEFFPVSAGPVSVQRALDELGSTLTEMVERERDGSLKKDRSLCTADKHGNRCPYAGTPLCTEDPK